MGHMLKIKCVDSKVNVKILGSTSVPFTLTTVQVPNLALTHTRRITVHHKNWRLSPEEDRAEPSIYCTISLILTSILNKTSARFTNEMNGDCNASILLYATVCLVMIFFTVFFGVIYSIVTARVFHE
jgi:hypothetical protein